MNCILLFLALAGSCLAGNSNSSIVRHLPQGSYRGYLSSNSLTVSFFNIPYAAPPVGPLRFRPPQPPLNLSNKGIQDASNKNYPSSSCMVNLRSHLNFGANPSEDCLRLNIYTPINARRGKKYPVYVHVFGSAFRDHYHGHEIYVSGAHEIIGSLREDAIIVTMNYRLGVFGWYTAPELAKDNALNLGLQDVIAAFKWVKKNIAEFGGDPNSITASGLSAGGVIITSLIFANDGKLNLFNRAVLQSGFFGPILETTETMAPVADLVAKIANCTNVDRIDCLRKLTAEQLMEVSYRTNYHVIFY